ncbi:hypothetical protein BDZ89DRAFT_1151269 [Hymenopellis radicata]|nr:hypothetical protein BDZ89DRAFT_1151269 [Hymenopellis radicata]
MSSPVHLARMLKIRRVSLFVPDLHPFGDVDLKAGRTAIGAQFVENRRQNGWKSGKVIPVRIIEIRCRNTETREVPRSEELVKKGTHN